MIKNGLLGLDDIYPHLYPADEDIGKEFMDYLESVNAKSKTAGRFGPTLVFFLLLLACWSTGRCFGYQKNCRNHNKGR
jgi:hypothetical protein